MIATRNEVNSIIDSLSDSDFAKLCSFLNSIMNDTDVKHSIETQFIAEVKAAEQSVSQGNYVSISELHNYLGV